MLLSQQHNFLFFKVGKAASTVMEEALPVEHVDRNKALDVFWSNFGKAYNEPNFTRRGHGINKMEATHVSARVIQRHDLLPKAAFDKLTKFCFVRNPWDRMVSLYSAHKNDNESHKSFEEFVKELPSNVERVGQEKYFTDFKEYAAVERYTPQVDYVFDADGNKVADFVGKYENLEDDFTEIYRIVYNKERHRNALGGDINKTHHDHYSTFYTDELRDIVGQVYQQDVEKFGYEVDDAPRIYTEEEKLWGLDKPAPAPTPVPEPESEPTQRLFSVNDTTNDFPSLTDLA